MREEININDYRYDLPEDRIALHPLQERDQSRLLVYKDGAVAHHQFKNIVDFLPENATLFFNNTKVIPARLFFTKDTGAEIEIFLLNPLSPSTLVQEAMIAKGTSAWQCTIGNVKRWAEGTTLKKQVSGIELTVTLTDKTKGIVAFSWQPLSLSFAEIITQTGVTPLPPYLKREAESADLERYQTVYSKQEGAVAAPTAGLHFTDAILQRLATKGIATNYLTLHVSAGTFMPVKTDNALEHTMHAEQVVITKQNLEAFLQPARTFIAVGTTSVRTMESVYWFGVKLLTDKSSPFIIKQDEPYEMQQGISRQEAMQAVLHKMNDENTEVLFGETSIYIVPGYSFRMCEALITNFHQPGSTLMLLVSAFIGEGWKEVYQQALRNEYRFLSYGDSSLLFKSEAKV